MKSDWLLSWMVKVAYFNISEDVVPFASSSWDSTVIGLLVLMLPFCYASDFGADF